MPVNRNALIRYKTIDACLRNRYRQWTLEDLIEACSEALYEYEGRDKSISRRTIQMDIQLMRSEKLGYNAPIQVVDKKYYTYADPEYTITNIPLSRQDLSKLADAVDILREFKGFSHFRELSGLVQRLEDKVMTTKTDQRSIIDLEKNVQLKGLEYIDPIYQTILKKKCLEVRYRSFKALQADTFAFHPFLLKEYRNRWFVLGTRDSGQPLTLLALDRMEEVAATELEALRHDGEQIDDHFSNVIGVTVHQGAPVEDVRLFVHSPSAPYVLTKPIHHSQTLVEEHEDGIVISLALQINFELEREILGFGDQITVLTPPALRSRIQYKLGKAFELYDSE